MIDTILRTVEAVFSIVASVAALWAGSKAHKAYNLVRGVFPSYDKVTPKNKRRLRSSGLFGDSPFNANADAGTVADKIDGLDPVTGQQLPFRKFAFGYEAEAFGLGVNYAFPEGSNISASLADACTSLVKLQGRKRTLADGNQYDNWDMDLVAAKAALRMFPDLMDDEPLSKNYKKPSKSSGA